jgi:hypothetical protein
MVFTTFCFLIEEKKNSKFWLAPLKVLTNFENPSSNPLQKPYSGDFDTENATGSHL